MHPRQQSFCFKKLSPETRKVIFDREHSSRGLRNSFDGSSEAVIEFLDAYFQVNFVIQTRIEKLRL